MSPRVALVLAQVCLCAVTVHALTATELAKFSVDSSITTNQGTANGATLTPSLTVTSSGTSHTFAGNMVPPHATGSAYTQPITTYISAQSSSIEVPSSPTKASSTTCLPAGTAGVAVNGVAVFSAYSRPCTDAIADEAIGFDSCDGHPQEVGTYHYHYKSACLAVKSAASGGDATIVTSASSQQLYGVSLDGFPIYNKWDASGSTIANSQLDDCHGYDPGDGTGYRYIVNDEFPYIIGCFVGTPLSSISCHCEGGVTSSSSGGGTGPSSGGPPGQSSGGGTGPSSGGGTGTSSGGGTGPTTIRNNFGATSNAVTHSRNTGMGMVMFCSVMAWILQA